MFTQNYNNEKPLVFSNGNTLLHHTLLNHSYAEIKNFIETEEQALYKMAVTTNDEGKIPLDLLIEGRTKLSEIERNNISQFLLATILKNQTEKLSDEIKIKDLKSYNNHKNKHLYATLKRGITFANETRKTFDASTTHVQFNTLSLQEQEALDEKFKTLTAKLHKIELEIRKQNSHLTQHQILKHILIKKVECLKQYKIGNCQQLSEFALNQMLLCFDKIPEIFSVELFYIENGDHAFLVLNRAKDSMPHDYEAWGPTAVVCDIWFGKVFPASEIPQLLKCHKSYTSTRSCNVSVSFNPNIHKLNVVPKSLSKRDLNREKIIAFESLQDFLKCLAADQNVTEKDFLDLEKLFLNIDSPKAKSDIVAYFQDILLPASNILKTLLDKKLLIHDNSALCSIMNILVYVISNTEENSNLIKLIISNIIPLIKFITADYHNDKFSGYDYSVYARFLQKAILLDMSIAEVEFTQLITAQNNHFFQKFLAETYQTKEQLAKASKNQKLFQDTKDSGLNKFGLWQMNNTADANIESMVCEQPTSACSQTRQE